MDSPVTPKILATPSFQRQVKKLPLGDKAVVEVAVLAIVDNPSLGSRKKGDLAAVLSHKFKLKRHDVLLAYALQPDQVNPTGLVLLNLGNISHDLKR